MITQDELRRIFDYENGNLIWRVRMGQRTKLGQPAGSIGAGGYVCIKILRRSYLAHRLIYLYHYGELPLMLDHKDRNVLNNRIENLRPATGSENQYNHSLDGRCVKLSRKGDCGILVLEMAVGLGATISYLLALPSN